MKTMSRFSIKRGILEPQRQLPDNDDVLMVSWLPGKFSGGFIRERSFYRLLIEIVSGPFSTFP
jgi:hypothetical protein